MLGFALRRSLDTHYTPSQPGIARLKHGLGCQQQGCIENALLLHTHTGHNLGACLTN